MNMADEKVMCHHTAFEKRCRDMVFNHRCPKWVTLRGKDPQTGAEVDRGMCVDSALPMLLIENSQMSRQTGAAVESFRNEVVSVRDRQARIGGH